MYSRVVNGHISLDKLDEAIRIWRDSVAPSVKGRKGFKSARLLVERDTGKIMSIGFWEKEADVVSTSEWNQEQVAKFATLFTSPPNVVEHYEVVVEV